MPSIITMSQLPKFTRIHALSGTAMLVRAGAGVGKTTFYRDWAHEQGPDYFYASLNASTAMLADIIGFLLPHDEIYDGRTIPVGKFTFPYFMRDERSGKPVFLFTKGLLVIDEVDKAGPAEKKALAILQEEGRLGEWRLPPGIQIVLLGNRQKDRSGSTKEFDFIINRRAEYELRPDMMSWIIWAQSHDITIETMAFANHNPDTIFGGDIPDEQGPWPTPRSHREVRQVDPCSGERRDRHRPQCTRQRGHQSRMVHGCGGACRCRHGCADDGLQALAVLAAALVGDHEGSRQHACAAR